MKTIEVTEKVFKIVGRITGKRYTKINMNNSLKEELSLDSIQIVELFASLEKEFEIELPLKMMTVKTGKEFLDILNEELNKKVMSSI